MLFFNWLAGWRMTHLHRLSSGLAWLLCMVMGYRKKLIIKHLSETFPAKTPAEINGITQRFYQSLADVIVEVIKLPVFSETEIKERMQIEGIELLQKYQQQNQPILAFGAHYANWEWVSSGLTRRGIAAEAVYKPLSSPFFEALMRHIRTAHGPTVVPMQRVGRELVARRHEFRVVGLIADQSPHEPEHAHWLPFLGRDTAFFPGLEKLAISLKMPVVYAEVIRQRRGYYLARFTLIAEPPYDNLPPQSITARCKDKLETIIKENPADWLWSHDRWKYSRNKF
jgi:Kdo2-lipid IVA lauroyltransferase/acyltransferase